MEIQYLKQLNNYPSLKRNTSDYVKSLEPISETEIINLESSYNNGLIFPAALRELLYLAGNYCYVLDYSLYESQKEMQEEQRFFLTDHGKTISRPFFVIDTYNCGDQFLFVYLDTGNDPIVYEALLYNETTGWIHSLNKSLSEFIDQQMTTLLSGFNPF